MDSYTEESLNSDEKCNSLHIRKPVWKSPSLKMRTRTKRKQRKETSKIFRRCRLTKRVRKSVDETENNDGRSSGDEIETLRSEDCSETSGQFSDFMHTLYEEFILAESLPSQYGHPKESTFMHGKGIAAKFPEDMSHTSQIAQGSPIQNEDFKRNVSYFRAESLPSQYGHPKGSTFMHGKAITAKFPEDMSHISQIAQGSPIQNEAESHRGQHTQLNETFIPCKEVAVRFPDEMPYMSLLAEGSTIRNDDEIIHGQHAHLKESTFIPGKEMTLKFPEEVSNIYRLTEGSTIQNDDFNFGSNDISLDVQNIIEPEKLEESLFREKLPEPNFIESETVSSTAKHGKKKSQSLDVTENQDSGVIEKATCCASRFKVNLRSKVKSRSKGPEEKTLCETELPVYPFPSTSRKIDERVKCGFLHLKGPEEKALCETELPVYPFPSTSRKVSICSLSRSYSHRFDAKIIKKPLRVVPASVMERIRSFPLCPLSSINRHKLKPIDEKEEELI